MITINLLSPRIGASPILPPEWMTPMKDTKDQKNLPLSWTEYLKTHPVSDSQVEPEDSKTSGFPNTVRHHTDRPLTEAQTAPVSFSSPDKTPAVQIVRGEMGNALSARVLVRLQEAESRESDVWLRDDYKIAALTVIYASEDRVWGLDNEGDNFGPWEFAFCIYLGKHPKKLIPFFVERAERHRLMNLPDFDPTLKIAPRLYQDCKKEIA